MSKNPLTLIMETNKFNGMNYNDSLRNMRIVLDFKNQGYVLDKPLPTVFPEGSSPEERITFEKWLEDNHKVRNIILASMTKDIQKQYDSLYDVPLIMLHMKDVYAVPNRHTRYAATKVFFGTKMAERSFVQGHGVKMLPLVGKLEDLKAGLDNDTAEGAPTTPTGKGKGKGKVRGYQRSKANDVCMHCQQNGHWKRECPQLLSKPSAEKKQRLSKDKIILRMGNGKAVAAEAVWDLSV
ncbi:UNVERIFIED_CONTAM: hypothetical protein Scaly_2580000 [Sesamum calycinum]|uniref:CCHC-type domain-containing protein n=1 Tax=Sesamum calycinum TaxID=2727403 RepID=A0AAW2JER0_9LAMI